VDFMVLFNTGKQKEMVQQYVKDFNIYFFIASILFLGTLENAYCESEHRTEPYTIKIIFDDRDHVIDLINMSYEATIKNIKDFQYPSVDTSLISKSKAYKEWMNNESSIVTMVMRYKEISCNYMQKCNRNVIDTFYIKLFISMLDYQAADESKNVNDVLRYLTLFVSFKDLQQYSPIIKKKLKYCKAPLAQKLQLLCLLELSETEKQSILNNLNEEFWAEQQQEIVKLKGICDPKDSLKNVKTTTTQTTAMIAGKFAELIPPWAKYRFGGIDEEKELMKLFEGSNMYREKKKYVEYMINSGKSDLQKYLIRKVGYPLKYP
jgi:hypothetical protein